MHIEIKDLQSGETHRIEKEGARLGRDKNRGCDIVIADAGVSGLHARIHLSPEEKWLLEDLKSSNGTFLDNERVRDPVALGRGTTFRFHTRKFEVLDIDPDPEGGRTAVFQGPPITQDTNVAALGKPAPEPDKETRVAVEPQKTTKPAAEPKYDTKPEPKTEPARAQEEEEEAQQAPTHEMPKMDKPKPAAEKPKPKKAAAPTTVGEPDVGGGFMADLMAAVGHYMVAVPKLLFAFRPMIEESIAHQRFPAMKPPQLIAWSIPPLALGQAIGLIVTILALIVSGTFSVGAIIKGLVMLALVPIIGAVVGGYIFHPLMGWLIKVLGGESDEKARSNYFVSVLTAVGLTTAISGLASIFAIIPLPFVGIVPVLLSAGASLISLYVFSTWLQSFNVKKWVGTVFLVLGALLVLSTLWNSFQVVRGGIASLGSGSSDGPSSPNIVQLDGGDSAKPDTTAAKPDTTKPDTAKPDTTTKPDTAAKPDTHKPDTPKPDPKQPVVEDKPPKGNLDSYDAYLKKREEVEALIAKNPTLLTRIDGVLSLYRSMHKETDKIKDKYKKSKEQGVVTDRLRDAEIYDKTAAEVAELHKKLTAN